MTANSIVAAGRGGRQRGEALGQGDVRLARHVEQAEQLAFLGMVGAGRVARRRADAPVLFTLWALEMRCGVRPALLLGGNPQR